MGPYESQSSGNVPMGTDLKIPTIREVAEKSKVRLFVHYIKNLPKYLGLVLHKVA